MKHRLKTHKIGRGCKHRKALLNNLATSILLKGLSEDQMERSIKTTLARAKAVRGLVERLITYAKKGDLTAKRMARKSINNREAFKGLFESLNERYKDRVGGYTRILKLSSNRHGDNAEMAMISLVEDEVKNKPKKKSKEKKSQAKPTAKRTNAPKPKTGIAEKPEGKSTEKTETQAKPPADKTKAKPEAATTAENKAEEAEEAPKPKKPAANKVKKTQAAAAAAEETSDNNTKEKEPSAEIPKKSEAAKPAANTAKEQAEKKKEEK
jgi:large subunit ribosomal protein L17